MFISRLIIKNFRNLAYVDLALSGGLNIIVGANGAGKTNLLYSLRLLIDSALSISNRQLSPEDFHISSGGPRKATEILVAAEFGYDATNTADSNLARIMLNDGVPRLAFRFRPNPAVRYQINNEGRGEDDLSLDEYEPELFIGKKVDYAKLTWRDELDEEPKSSPLQRYHVTELPALRDVVAALRSERTSPLARLIETIKIDEQTESRILRTLAAANSRIARTQSLRDLSKELTDSYIELLSTDTPPSIALQLAEPSLPQILRSLNVVLSDATLSAYGLDRNGLGFNNLLYAAMQIEVFRRGLAASKPGKLLLVEEPEAHLHPHAQEAFLNTLNVDGVQTVVTTHSPHVTSQAGIRSIVAISSTAEAAYVTRVASAANLTDIEADDLDRYLDATKASLLFARRVVLVEGGAELQLMSAFAHSKNIDLARRGISVIAVHGTHFDVFSKLFETGALALRCAIIRDGDDFRDSDGNPDTRFDNGEPQAETSTERVRTFKTRSTLEYAICQPRTLPALKDVAVQFGATGAAKVFEAAISSGDLGVAQRQAYRLSIQVGKARFAQTLARHKIDAPPYIAAALSWVNS